MAADVQSTRDKGPGVTRALALWLAAPQDDPVSDRAITCARHVVLDWLGVTLAGMNEPLSQILLGDARSEGTGGVAHVLGQGKFTGATAALVNGAASHTLDYDDINTAMRGHPTVAVLPAVLGAADKAGASGYAVLEALIAGTEVACVLGEMMGAAHYTSGFHTTATVGTVAAAAGVCRLMKLDADCTEMALGLAATQAAGLRSMFGTMAKPLHAGRAAETGLRAARWADAGVTSCVGAIEAQNGFGPVLSSAFSPRMIRTERPMPFGIEGNVFKYHATCYYTHAVIEAMRSLRREGRIDANDLASMEIGLLPELLDVCDIIEPSTGLEVKFSARHLAAMALLGRDTSNVSLFNAGLAADPEIIDLRQRITVVPAPVKNRMTARVRCIARAAPPQEITFETGQPEAELKAQENRLATKFQTLAKPVVGAAVALELQHLILDMHSTQDLGAMWGLACPNNETHRNEQ